jgi:hypothetical protein
VQLLASLLRHDDGSCLLKKQYKVSEHLSCCPTKAIGSTAGTLKVPAEHVTLCDTHSQQHACKVTPMKMCGACLVEVAPAAIAVCWVQGSVMLSVPVTSWVRTLAPSRFAAAAVLDALHSGKPMHQHRLLITMVLQDGASMLRIAQPEHDAAGSMPARCRSMMLCVTC